MIFVGSVVLVALAAAVLVPGYGLIFCATAIGWLFYLYKGPTLGLSKRASEWLGVGLWIFVLVAGPLLVFLGYFILWLKAH